MTPTQWRAVLTLAQKLDKEDDALDDVLKQLFKLLAPSNFPPFIETTRLSTLCDTLDALYPGSGELVSYFIYDAQSIAKRNDGKCICKDKDGKEYNASKMGEYIEFLMVE